MKKFHLLLIALMMVTGIVIGNVLTISRGAGSCGLANAAFCDTFDTAGAGGGRSGQLPAVWGASRTTGNQNLGQSNYGIFYPSHNTACGGQLVQPDNDIVICNGHLTESTQDGQSVTSLAMYPKQPFDFAGRTGKIVFDVSDDTQGSHGAWPELWLTDRPVPAPFTHEGGGTLPANGFGIRFEGNCPGGGVTVGSAVVVRNYVADDSFFGGTLIVNSLACVGISNGATLNHFEVDVAQNQLDVYGTAAGTTSPLVHLATIPNANLTFTRGLMWLEDVHYNANKFGTQGDHTFIWDNAGFDGPVLARDIAYEVPDSLVPYGDGSLNLGWRIDPGSPHVATINVNSGALSTAAAVLLEFDAISGAPANTTYALNGNPAHTVPMASETIAIPVAKSELQVGSNTISIQADGPNVLTNVSMIMVGAGGNGQPPPTATATATATKTPTVAPTPPPNATATPIPLSQCFPLLDKVTGSVHTTVDGATPVACP